LIYKIAVGHDGNVWFTEGDSMPGQSGPTIGKVTPSGEVTYYSIQNAGSNAAFGTYSIAVGPDKNIWFTDFYGFDRVTPSGTITQFALPNGDYFRPTYLVTGTDGKVYADAYEGDMVGQIVSCDQNGGIMSFGPFGSIRMEAPLVWYGNRLLGVGWTREFAPVAMNDAGRLQLLKPQFTIPAGNGPNDSLVSVSNDANSLHTGHYGIGVFRLERSALVGLTYPEIINSPSGAADIMKVVADSNGFFWAMNESSIMRFRYDP
jgi:streptogramin lyase